MKFGSQLKSQRPSQWKFYFVDYDGLKALLKSKSLGRTFTEQDEEHFTNQLVQELVKVASFQSIKLNEIRLRTEHCEDTIRQDQHGDSSALPHTHLTKRTGEKLTLASFVVTEAEINKITEDIQDLARFQRLNYTAFLKILKKHDKHTGFELRHKFITRHLSEHPFHKQSLEPIVKRLSSLYSIVRTGMASPTVSRAQSIVSADYEDEHDANQARLVSKKTSFWVHPDNIMDLKMLILKYLPLVVYEPTPALNSSHRSTSQLCERLSSESPVSTVYLDNADLDLYMSHVEQQDREETIRMRWYGAEQKQIWVERQQQHHQRSASGSLLPPATTGSSSASPSSSAAVAATVAATVSSSSSSPASEGSGDCNDDGGGRERSALTPTSSTKHRFPIKAKHVPGLLRGEANVEKIVNQLRLQAYKPESEVQAFKDKTQAVQARIQKRGLVPVVQTFFNRTAFQVPGDCRVRITLDTEVAMVREFNDHRCGCLKRGEPCPHWRRTDIQAADYPFSWVKKDDLTLFPYAIMSIKTLTDDPQEDVPVWVDHIAQSHLVEMVPNFTKDQHAIATLYEYQASLLPFWLSDMDRDIRKPARLSGSSPNTRSQDSNSNAGSSSNSNDTLHSLQSATNSLTSVSDGGLVSPLSRGDVGSSTASPQDSRRGKKTKERQGILDRSLFTGPQQQQGVTFQETLDEIVVVQRAAVPTVDTTLEVPPISTSKLSPSGSTPVTSPTTPTTPRPIVGCLKKYPSTSSLRSDRSNNSSHGSVDYGSCNSREQSPQHRRRKRRVTFKSKTRIMWERAQAHLPNWVINNALTDKFHQFQQERRERQEQRLWEQEQQQQQQLQQQQQAYQAVYDIDDHDSTTTITYTRLQQQQQQQQRRLQQQARRQAWIWSGLTVANMILLFIGLLVALLNFGDGIGEEAASLYLIVSCLGMGSTVWVYLVQREGWDKVDADDEDEFQWAHYNHDRYPTTSNSTAAAAAMLDEDDEEEQQFMERQGLLPQYQQQAAYAKKSARYQAHRSQRRMRFLTRAATLATFLSLLAVVSLNLLIRMNYEEDENSM
ncbi:vacuolar transporter chaperone [Actinomortierella ambigua]|nr:vacuolar transporter chaperone [Actinomortierella ambigua]